MNYSENLVESIVFIQKELRNHNVAVPYTIIVVRLMVE